MDCQQDQEELKKEKIQRVILWMLKGMNIKEIEKIYCYVKHTYIKE